MNGAGRLTDILRRIDGRGYKAYRDITGSYRFPRFDLHIDHVQGDPYATPSRARITVTADEAAFSPRAYENRSRRVALGDFLTRAFAAAIGRCTGGRVGTGRGGVVSIEAPGQEILERTSCIVNAGAVEARFRVGLPAEGRRILGEAAARILCNEVPRVAEASLFYASIDPGALSEHLDVNEDQDAARAELARLGLVAFIADGAILPRRSGIDDRPLSAAGGAAVVPFTGPASITRELRVPHAGAIRGTAIPEGVTLIVGGGFHGKSTLLRALERGVYNHIPGDGRERVITRGDAVKIRSEDGRSVAGVDIRPFIGDLPFGADTASFTTKNASGSTSQAANIIEALEMGCRLLLIDEDTSATNFMIRDERMRELVAKAKEPITPFVDKIGPLRDELGVSTILVMGGSGDYFDAADLVVMMDAYEPRDVTAAARRIAGRGRPSGRREERDGFGPLSARGPLRESFDPRRGRSAVAIDAKGPNMVLYGRHPIDLSAVEQLVSRSQTRAIGDIIQYFSTHHAHRGVSLREGLEAVMEEIGRSGLDILSSYQSGEYALPRMFEVAAAVNRMRTLRVREVPRGGAGKNG
jgi:predicted ABC-class ATPase